MTFSTTLSRASPTPREKKIIRKLSLSFLLLPTHHSDALSRSLALSLSLFLSLFSSYYSHFLFSSSFPFKKKKRKGGKEGAGFSFEKNSPLSRLRRPPLSLSLEEEEEEEEEEIASPVVSKPTHPTPICLFSLSLSPQN